MDDQQAVNVLIALANGTHPLTGEIFPQDSPYQAPTVVRALFVAVRALETARVVIDPASLAGRGAPVSLNESQSGSQHRSGNGKTADAEKSGTGRTNVGKPWSTEEDSTLLAAFDAQQSIAELAKAHGRTQNGVRARLEKHGRLPPSDASRWAHSTKQATPVSDVDVRA